jgi:hypothetical protein
MTEGMVGRRYGTDLCLITDDAKGLCLIEDPVVISKLRKASDREKTIG